MPTVYRTSAPSTGDGRNGHIRTDDGELDLDLATPGAQGGPGGATNPEHAGGPVALNPVRAADLRYVGPAAVVGQGELMS